MEKLLGLLQRRPLPASSESRTLYLIVGLGNPGREYADTRHNVGFQIVSRLAEKHALAFSRKQMEALVASGIIAGARVVLAKPQTWMNASGRAVASLVRFYKVEPDRLLVIYDDLDLPPGMLRLRPKGGDGGHKGMKSIIEKLGAQDFPRLRVGIGRPPGRMDAVEYVLQPFGREEIELITAACARAIEAIETFIQHGIAEAMNKFN